MTSTVETDTIQGVRIMVSYIVDVQSDEEVLAAQHGLVSVLDLVPDWKEDEEFPIQLFGIQFVKKHLAAPVMLDVQPYYSQSEFEASASRQMADLASGGEFAGTSEDEDGNVNCYYQFRQQRRVEPVAGVVRLSLTGEIEYIQPDLARALGYCEDILTGKSLDRFLRTQQTPRSKKYILDLIQLGAGQIQQIEGPILMITRDGYEIPAQLTLNASRDNKGNIRHLNLFLLTVPSNAALYSSSQAEENAESLREAAALAGEIEDFLQES